MLAEVKEPGAFLLELFGPNLVVPEQKRPDGVSRLARRNGAERHHLCDLNYACAIAPGNSN